MKKIQKLLVGVIGLFLVTLPTYAQTKLKIAILDPVITGEKLSDGVGIGVREIISGSFVNNGDNYAIVERSMLNKVMEEANFSNTDAVDENQATRLGKLAGADKVVLTVISKVDQRCLFSIKMINVETATIDHQISKMVDYNSLLDVAEPMTLVILGKGDINSIASASPSNGSIISPQSTISSGGTFAQFKGAGVTFFPVGYDFSYQPEEFPLNNMSRILHNPTFNVVFDLSEAVVGGVSLIEYAQMKGWADDIDRDMRDETMRFVQEMNKWKEYNFGYNPSAPITLVVKVRELSDNGKENISDYVFVDTESKQPLTGIRLKSKGGRFGSFANLFGDALEEDAAPKIRGKLKSSFKKLK